VESQVANDGGAVACPRRAVEPDMSGPGPPSPWTSRGRRDLLVGVTARRLFRGYPEQGRRRAKDICDVLLTGPGQESSCSATRWGKITAGRCVDRDRWPAGTWGEGRFAIRWEPLGGASAGRRRLVIAQRRVPPDPSASWLSEAAGRIGTTLDLTQTAIEGPPTVAVPRVRRRYLDLRLGAALAGGPGISPQPWPRLGRPDRGAAGLGHTRLAGLGRTRRPAACLPPGEGARCSTRGSPSAQAMGGR